MEPDKQQELAAVESKIRSIQLKCIPGWIMVALGVYGIYTAGDDAFHQLVNNSLVHTGLIVLGGLIMLYELYVLIPLFKRQHKIRNNQD